MRKIIIILTSIFVSCILMSQIIFYSNRLIESQESYDYYLYFSQTMDHYLPTGRVIGVGSKNKIIKKTSGLELGRLSQDSNNNLHFSDRYNDYIYYPVGNKVLQINRETKEHTGVNNLTINGNPLHIFNHGFAEDGSYETNFYFKNSKFIMKEWIFSTTSNENYVFSIGERGGLVNELYLTSYQVSNNAIQIYQTHKICNSEEYFFPSDMVANEDFIYAMAFEGEEFLPTIFTYSLNTNETNFHKIPKEIKLEDSPPSCSNNLQLYEGNLVYFSGNGNIYYINAETFEIIEVIKSEINLTGVFLVSESETNKVAIVSYDENYDLIISTFDLESKTFTFEKQITSTMWGYQEHLYDFEVRKK